MKSHVGLTFQEAFFQKQTKQSKGRLRDNLQFLLTKLLKIMGNINAYILKNARMERAKFRQFSVCGLRIPIVPLFSMFFMF